MKVNGFGRDERLKKNRDFQKIIKKGKSARSPYLMVKYLRNDLPFSRWAVVLSRDFGIAVKRNKIKRRVREIIRTNKNLIKRPYDAVIFPRREVLSLDYEGLKIAILELFENAGLANGKADQ